MLKRVIIYIISEVHRNTAPDRIRDICILAAVDVYYLSRDM